jgi:hypothetical protein
MDRKFKMVNATKKPFVVPRYRRGNPEDNDPMTLRPAPSRPSLVRRKNPRRRRREARDEAMINSNPVESFFWRLGQSLVRLLRRLHCVPRETDETRHAARLTISEISLALRRSRPISHPRLVVVHARHLCRRSRSPLYIVIHKQMETALRV